MEFGGAVVGSWVGWMRVEFGCGSGIGRAVDGLGGWRSFGWSVVDRVWFRLGVWGLSVGRGSWGLQNTRLWETRVNLGKLAPFTASATSDKSLNVGWVELS